ncbi:DUF6199 family natural product biosynthesis protein [Bacillus sp. FJAT-45066]|uniref:DUF6199 family natural product biosynthesis protein n=1 Tax=Bacillus sp. FJAT-45066 TaxID=2011010 RepID=UPI000BB9384A|nr:DUF6199 family natural product biosynthesis protein [Bacillus sp. FJAT-45066]
MIIYKQLIVLLFIFLFIPITAVAESDSRVVVIDGQEFTVTASVSSIGYGYTVLAPDGTKYSYNCNTVGTNMSTCSGKFIGENDFTMEEDRIMMERMDKAISEYELTYGVPREEKSKSSSGNFFTGLLAIAVGAFLTFAPRSAWYLEIGWKLKDSEPSEAAILMNVFGGIILGIVGIVMMFT